MAELTADMVWFVNKDVILPSGKKLTVLTPQVYLVARNLDVTSQGALISAREIMGNINGKLTNTGTIGGAKSDRTFCQEYQQPRACFGGSVNLLAKQKLVNLGGRIEALDSVTLVGKEGVDIAVQQPLELIKMTLVINLTALM